MEVKWGIIRLISSGILGPTNKVFSVQEVIPELARSRAILASKIQNEATTIKARMALMSLATALHSFPPTPPPPPHNTLPTCQLPCTRWIRLLIKSFICSYFQCGD